MSTDGVVSKNAAKDILKIMFNNGGKPIDIAKENGFIMDNDTSGLEEIIDKIIAENADSVESYKNGNQKVSLWDKWYAQRVKVQTLNLLRTY